MPQKSDDHKGQSRWLGFLQIVLILAVVVVALYFARAPDRVERETVSALSAEDTKPVVSVVQPTQTSQSLTVELTGSVSLSERARINSEVAGRVIWVSPKLSNGGSIEANERFVKIDPAEYELRVKMADSAVEAAEAQVRIEEERSEEHIRVFLYDNPGAEVPDRVRGEAHIAKARAELMKARAEMEMARLDLARTDVSLPYARQGHRVPD